MSIINWIDKMYDEIKTDSMFAKYFDDSKVEEIEDRYYIINNTEGIDISFSGTLLVESIHLFSGTTDYGEYCGEIPNGLNFTISQTAVRNLLKNPNKSGGGYTDIYGFVPPWDKFYFDHYSLHVQYSTDHKKITLITVASLSLEAYFNIGLQ